jgi:hypothetical protein
MVVTLFVFITGIVAVVMRFRGQEITTKLYFAPRPEIGVAFLRIGILVQLAPAD